MTMLSFRVDDHEAREASEWARRKGVDRSQLLRDALRAYLVRLHSEEDALRWQKAPLTSEESSLAQIADWGQAEEWVDWQDAAR